MRIVAGYLKRAPIFIGACFGLGLGACSSAGGGEGQSSAASEDSAAQTSASEQSGEAESTSSAATSQATSSEEAGGASSEEGVTTHEAFSDNSTSDGTGDLPNPNGPEVVNYEFCESDWGESANITGTMPGRTFNGRYAWFGWLTCWGDALSPTLVITENAEDLQDALILSPSGDAVPTPSLEWYLFGACNPSGGWVGEGVVTVYLRDTGGWQQGRGRVTINDTYRMFDEVDELDPPRMMGSIVINDMEAGWDISGDFTAAYCGALSYPLDCQ